VRLDYLYPPLRKRWVTVQFFDLPFATLFSLQHNRPIPTSAVNTLLNALIQRFAYPFEVLHIFGIIACARDGSLHLINGLSSGMAEVEGIEVPAPPPDRRTA